MERNKLNCRQFFLFYLYSFQPRLLRKLHRLKMKTNRHQNLNIVALLSCTYNQGIEFGWDLSGSGSDLREKPGLTSDLREKTDPRIETRIRDRPSLKTSFGSGKILKTGSGFGSDQNTRIRNPAANVLTFKRIVIPITINAFTLELQLI